ncbi:MAG: SIMPL domain-containing protein [Polyangiales bacterium]
MAAPSTPGVPARELVSAGVVVRPDLVCVPFAVHVLDGDADKAVATAHALVDEVTSHLRAAAGGAGVVKMRGIAVSPVASAKKSGSDEVKSYALVADGSFEVPLAAALDFWGRSKLVSALVASSRKDVDAHLEGPAKVSFETPQMRVHDPEVHRPALTKQWIERARAFAEAAQGPSQGPLALVDCQAPGEIAQHHVSTEEVALTLSIACRLDARPSK